MHKDKPNILTGLTNGQVLSEIEGVLQAIPPRDRLHLDEEVNHAWLGRAHAAINNWGDGAGMVQWSLAESDLDRYGEYSGAPMKMARLLHQAQNDLRMKTIGPVNVAVGQGQVFAYMDTMRKLLQMAKKDVLFVDRYINGDFVSDYLPHLTSGVAIRILTRRDQQTQKHIAALLPMAKAFSSQYSQSVEIRTHSGFHDRHLFIDGIHGYSSSCLCKDGPRTAGAVISQHEPAILAKVMPEHEEFWSAGTLEQ